MKCGRFHFLSGCLYKKPGEIVRSLPDGIAKSNWV